MMRVLVAESRDFSADAASLLRSYSLPTFAELDRAGLLRAIPQADVLWVRLDHSIDREVLDAGAQLRAIVSPTTGLDHIDVRLAAEREIAILSLRGEREFLDSISATAELTWGLLLSLTRRIPAAAAAVERGEWDRTRFRGHDLRGRTLGIVGLGRLGIQVARFGLAFGMRVLAYDPYQERWHPEVARCSTLRELLEASDAVSIHVPLQDATVRLIGAQEVGWMRPHAVLLNTSRGTIVDEAAVLEALEAGRLRGAALDVLPDERLADSPLAQRLIQYAARYENLLITPHLGGATFESMAATEIFMAQKLQRHLESVRKGFREPPNEAAA